MWQPVSGCGDDCRPGGEHTVGGARQVLRVGALIGVLLLAVPMIMLGRQALVPVVARGILRALGVRTVRRGPAPRAGSLLVANHVSWLDIVALLAAAPVRPVAKCEVGRWPLIGAFAGRTGAIFLDRTRPRQLPDAVAEVTAALRAGESVAAFPEGTTFCGATHGRFRPAFFQAAVDSGAPVVPVALTYDSTAAAFVGDDTLWDSVRRIAALRCLTVTVSASAPLRPAEGADRRLLARAAQASVSVTPAGLGLAA